ncbi:hypothetical protein OG21DRAFT_1509316 [Imleria badia]|nr:hypothetical protein OG21DRAFT_1509316 [Imleria badia]
MSYHDSASSHFSLWQSQSGRRSTHHTAHKSIYSADSRNPRSPLGISEGGAVTPAQAYASAVKTGEAHERALYYTIERKKLEGKGKGKANPHLVPSHLGDSGSPEHGPSFAQRLYANALDHKSSNLPSSNIPALPPIKYASSAVASSKTPLSTSFDTSSEVSQSFNPADLYHSSVAAPGFLSRGSTSPEASGKHSRPLLPVLQIPSSLLVTRSHQDNPQASYSSSQSSTPQLGVRNPRPVSHQFQTVSMEAQSKSTQVVGIHEASGLQGASVETPPHAVAGRATTLEQQLVIPPSSSPPAFEELEHVFNTSEEVMADITPEVIQSSATDPHQDGLPDSLLQSPPEVNHEEVPLYSLVDEQVPPPAFDDLQVINATSENSLVAQPEALSQEENLAPHSPSQSPPFSHGSTAYTPKEAPAYALQDYTLYPFGTSKYMLRDAKIPPPSSITGQTSSSSDSPNVVPTDFQPPNRTPSVSPPISLLPSNFRSLSVLSPQSRKTSYDPRSVCKGTTILPPPVNYHTKPTAKQSGRPLPPALRSGFRTPEDSTTVRHRRHDFQPVVNVAADNYAIDALTHSMSNMMGRPPLETHGFAFETLASGRQDPRGTSVGNQHNNLIISGSHPSGTRRTLGSVNHGISGLEAERLIQEVYQHPTHGETGGRLGYGIQGLGSANPPIVNILSSQQSPLRSCLPVQSLRHSHTEIVSTTGRINSQPG